MSGRPRKQSKVKTAAAPADDESGDSSANPGTATAFKAQRGPNTRDAQIAICKIYGFTTAQTASAISTPETPNGISETSVLRRLTVNRSWIEELVRWGNGIRRKTAVTSADRDVSASNLRTLMEKKLPQAWTVLEQAIDEGNLEMAMYVIEQVIGKPNQRHTMMGAISVEHTWKGRAELLAEEKDMLESERMLKLLPAADLSDVPEADVVAG